MADSVVKITLKSNQYEKGMRQAQKSWNDFMKGIGLSMSKFTAAGAAIGAVTGALKVAKDAFFKNEEQLDEWGRVVQSSQSLYSSFLNTLNSGDFSGFFHNIDNVVKAARSAYDAIDELATYNAFNRMNVADARANMSEAIGAYRLGEGSKEDVKSAVSNLKKELAVRQQKEWAAYIESVRSIAIDRGANPDDVVKLLGGSYVNFENVKKSWKPASYTKKNVLPMFGGGTVSGAMMGVNFGTRVSQTPGSDEERLANFARTLNDTELDKLQAMGEQAKNTKREIADLDKQLARVLNGRQPGSSGSGGRGSGGSRSGGGGGRSGGSSKSEPTYAADSLVAQQKLVAELTKQWNESGASVRDKYLQPLVEAEAKLKSMQNEMGLQKENAAGKLLGGDVMTSGLANESVSMSDFENQINAMIENLKINPIEIPIETTEKDVRAITMAARTTADVVGSIGDAFNAIEDPAAKVMGTVMQAIASVALGYAQATVEATSMGPWAWVAFAATGLATMLSTISAIHSATGYAQGGIVKGNSYSGDNIYGGPDAMVNAGELVLTKAQQSTLASQLQEGGMRNLNLSGRIRGTDIILSVDRTLSLEGKQLLTWGR